MEIDILRAELERLYELDELLAVAKNVLGLDPDEVGGTSGKGSFVAALTETCAEREAVEALCDVVLASKKHADPRIETLRIKGVTRPDELAAGTDFGPYTIVRKLGEGTAGLSYLATNGDRNVRLKVMRHEAVRDRRGLQRFLAYTRLAAQCRHAALPANMSVERVGAREAVVHDFIDSETLADRIGRSGPLHVSEARPILKTILGALDALHENRLTHGNVKLDNVFAARNREDEWQVVLVDAGGDRLRTRAPANGHIELLSVSSPKTIAPEQLRGSTPGPASDLYSFGALLFEVLTGRPVFTGGTAMDVLVAHLTAEPPAPSTVAPKGWVTREIDDFVLRLLAKDPKVRPEGAGAVLAALDSLGRSSVVGETAITEEELRSRIERVEVLPDDEDAAAALESAIQAGADARRVVEAFVAAAERVTDDPMADAGASKSLLYRAGRICQNELGDLTAAERIYTSLTESDPADATAQAKLEDVRRALGKYEEVIESLLARVEEAEQGPERARLLARIGNLYATELDDPEQAVVALTQAFCEDPTAVEYAAQIELCAGERTELWTEVLASCAEASAQETRVELKNTLLATMARWYTDRYARPDLALHSYQEILTTDPSHNLALEGLAALYRKNQQWHDLGNVLMQQSESSNDPVRRRALLCEAAKILDSHIHDVQAARDLYERVLSEDPSHLLAAECLGGICARLGDFAGQARLLEQQLPRLKGDERARIACRIAEIFETTLGDDSEAIARYRRVLEESEDNLDALRGLHRLYEKAGRFHELLPVLEAQISAATTPRQKMSLLERVAAIYGEEFFDHARAAEALERLLTIDPSHDVASLELERHYKALERWDDLANLLERHLGFVSDRERRLDIALERAQLLAERLSDSQRAIEAYESILEFAPAHAVALESLARLRETAGDEDAALEAILALAARAESGEARAQLLLRAARILAQRGEQDRAIEQYKLALDADPRSLQTWQALREAYVRRGDIQAALELMEQEFERTEGERQSARLSAEMAVLHLTGFRDRDKAAQAAKRSLDLDPTNTTALTVLADLAFDDDRYVEAAAYYEKLAKRAESLAHDEAVRILVRFVDSLSKGGSTEKALGPMDTLLNLAPDDVRALSRVASVTFEHGSPERARELYGTLLARSGDEMSPSDKAQAIYRVGESARRLGMLEDAVRELEQATDLEPSNPLPLVALASAYEAQEDWRKLVDVKTRHLDVADGDERVRLLIEIGEIAATKLEDRTLATKSFAAAVEERPNDRKLLMRLMQLYSEDKDWQKLVEVVLKLADFVDDTKQRAKYLQTAATIAGQELGDYDRALEFHATVLELNPDDEKSIDETIELFKLKGDQAGAVEKLKDKATRASNEKNTSRMLEAFAELGSLYQSLGRVGHAIDAYEAAQTIDPENKERNELLAELYASNPALYLDKAVAAQMAMLQQDPYREASYKLLRRLYTEAQRADPSWCLCQALYVLQLAEADEERFFRRMRSEDPAYARAVLQEDDWLNSLLHSDADALLTSIFAMIEPAVLATRGHDLEEFGYEARHAIDPEQHPHPISQTLHYAAGVMGFSLPPTFENPNDPGGLSFLHARTPSLALGAAALGADLPPQAAAFIAGRHLAYYRPGMYMRHLIPSGTGLKSWLFAAVKMNAPQFPVAPDIEGPVRDAMHALESNLTPQVRDHLARIVSKLLQSGRSLDLKRWVQGIDLSADRVGFLLAHDLETAVEIVRASDEASSSVSPQPRLKELVLFAISEPYFRLRERLQITIDS